MRAHAALEDQVREHGEELARVRRKLKRRKQDVKTLSDQLKASKKVRNPATSSKKRG